MDRKYLCQHCREEVPSREDLEYVHDRYGIPFKLVCSNCYDEVSEQIGQFVFDEAYAGESLEEDY